MGGTRPFGWKEDKATLEPAEAREIRRAVERIRAGIAPGAILKEWASREIRTTRGNTWQWAPFLMMLRNPRLCGYRGRRTFVERDNGARAYGWEIVKLADGTEVKGQWKSIISRAEWDDLISRIGGTAKPNDDYAGSVAKYLLSGVVRCGKCGGKMNGNRVVDGDKEYFYYVCPIKRQGGCGANTRNMAKVDELVEALALAIHAEGSSGDEVDPNEADVQSEIDRINRRLAEAYDAWKAEQLPAAEYFAMRADLEKDRTAFEHALRQAASAAIGSELDEIARRWPRATVDEKRAFVRAYFTAVVIHGIEDVWDERKGRMVHPTRFQPELIEPVRRRRVGAVAS